MEVFWGVEVKPGQALTCEFLQFNAVNLTQVALGETTRKDNERVAIYLRVDKKKIVLGTLINGRCHQIGLNLVFNKSFQISHSSKYLSLFFCGCSRIVPKWKKSVRDDDSDDDEEDKDSEDFHSSDDGNTKYEDEDEEEDEDEDEDDDIDKGTAKDLDDVSTSEDDSDDEEGGCNEDENMEDSRSDNKDEDSDDEVDSSEDDEYGEISTVAMMHGRNHKWPRPNSCIKPPKTNKKAKVVAPQNEKPGKEKKYVQFSTDYDGANKGTKKGKKIPGGSKKQSLASKKTPKSGGTPWPGKKDHSVAKQAKGH